MDSPTKRRRPSTASKLASLPPELQEAAQAHTAAQRGQAPASPVVTPEGIVLDPPASLHKSPLPRGTQTALAPLPPLIPRPPAPEQPKASAVMAARSYDPVSALIDMLEKDEHYVTTKEGNTIAVPLPADLKVKIHIFLADFAYSRNKAAEPMSGNVSFKIVIHKDV